MKTGPNSDGVAFMHGQSISHLVATRGSVSLTKGYRLGTHRHLDPEQTLAALVADLPGFGITRVARLTGLDRLGVEVFTAFRPNSLGLSAAQGKGTTAPAARLSAIMEAIECFVAETRQLDLRHGTLDEMAAAHGTDRVVSPRHAEDQLRAIDWTFATDLQSGERIVVPHDYVHAMLLQRGRAHRLAAEVSTNGLASGGNLVEALTHGLCEVIERVDTELFAEGFSSRAAFDLSRSDWPEFVTLDAHARERGFSIRVWETTGPVDVPSFMACLADMRDAGTPPGYGAGCHLSPRVALARAVHEAAQSRLTRISGGRDDLTDAEYEPRERLRARHFVTSAPPGPQRVRATDLSGDCLVQDLWTVVDRLQAIGVGRILAVDLADDPRFRVVKVIVPGLARAVRQTGFSGDGWAQRAEFWTPVQSLGDAAL